MTKIKLKVNTDEINLIEDALDYFAQCVDSNGYEGSAKQVRKLAAKVMKKRHELEALIVDEAFQATGDINWEPTHYHVHDHSTLMVTNDNPFMVMNECGDVWEDNPKMWLPIKPRTCPTCAMTLTAAPMPRFCEDSWHN